MSPRCMPLKNTTTMAVRGASFATCIARQNHLPAISLAKHLKINSLISPSHLCNLNSIPSYHLGKLYGLRFHVREIHSATAQTVASKKEDEKQSPQNWKIKMLYDGDCPLCMREVNMLRERNKEYGTIKFVDISSENYSPEENQDLDYETVMGRIHAILSDGTVVTDVEAFRRLYENVGLGWVYAITKYEPIGKLADIVYGFWAKYRLQVTGRPPMQEILEARKKGKTCKDSSSCKM